MVRYTNASDSNMFVQNYDQVIGNLEKSGYNVVRVKNTLADNSVSYRGIHTVIAAPDGFKFELQFHTPESLELKNKTHVLYEEWRLSSTSAERRKELDKQKLSLSKRFQAPKRCDHKQFDKLKDSDCMTYFAILYPGEDLETCWRIARNRDHIFERYDLKSDQWIENESLFLIAEEIISRLKSGETWRRMRNGLHKKGI